MAEVENPMVTILESMLNGLSPTRLIHMSESMRRVADALPGGSLWSVGTACSGCDLVIPSLQLFAETMAKHFDRNINISHLYSCECVGFKQDWIRAHFGTTVFCDITTLAGPQADTVEGGTKSVPWTFLFCCGIECDSISNNNAGRAQHFDTMIDETTCATGYVGLAGCIFFLFGQRHSAPACTLPFIHVSGGAYSDRGNCHRKLSLAPPRFIICCGTPGDTARACMAAIKHHGPCVFLLENVRNLAASGSSGKSILDALISLANASGYLVTPILMDAFRYGGVSVRERFYVVGVKALWAYSQWV